MFQQNLKVFNLVSETNRRGGDMMPAVSNAMWPVLTPCANHHLQTYKIAHLLTILNLAVAGIEPSSLK